MKRVLIVFLILTSLIEPVYAFELTAPSVPYEAADVMPQEPESFAEGLWQLLKAVIAKIQPEIAEASGVCLSLICVTLILSLLPSLNGQSERIAQLICSVTISAILLKPAHSLLSLGVQTIQKLAEYSKLLMPVMTTALAAQGGITKSAALYAGTTAFTTILTSAISHILVPMIYIYIAISIANSAMGENILKKLQDFEKWIISWSLKGVLYVFTGYMSLTGVISGTADASALKATKITIAGVVPVIGGMLSNASETVVLSAGIVKNAAGIYGLLAILAVFLHPFMVIGVQYMLLKLTAAVSSVYATKQASDLIQDFSTAMGILLGITGTVCLILLIGMACFMMGVS